MADAQQLAVLLDATAAGDERAFAELYRRTSAHLHAVLLRLLKRRDWAEEALQDSYLKIWQKAETYERERGAPLTWLCSVARYRGLDLLRTRDPEVAIPDADEEHTLPPLTLADESQDLLARAAEAEGIARMRDCLRHLDEDQRVSVLLAYYEGYTHSELARRLSAPLGTVKSWVRRGLVRLRECLEP